MPWGDAAFAGEFRRYQRLALDAFEADRAAGRRKTHIVAPPGSGKTVLGIEIARRLGAPALALAPTAAVQAQWVDKLALFGVAPGDTPLTALTYQALCRTEDPDGALRAAAVTRLGPAPDSQRRSAELARETARLKRELAAGGAADALLDAAVRERVEALRAAGVRTVVLDECHHLVSLWGYLIRAVLARLGDDVHVVGLTATAPEEVTAEQRELYSGLLGTVDFHTPTPAVVKEGFLAPFQELALFTEPLVSEVEWLRERHSRFDALLDRLMDTSGAELSLPVWVSDRLRHRADGDAEIPFGELLRTRPALARAGLRYLLSAGRPPPPGAPRGEGFREPPSIEDWVVLLEDYALRGLRRHPGPESEARLDELAVGLADLGFTLTRTGIRPGRTDIDRVLVHSAAKPLLVCEALAAEDEARGGDLRAVVLCDSERPPRRPEDSPLELGGGGRGLLATLAEDGRTAPLRPLLVTGESFACAPSDLATFEAEVARRGGMPADSRGWVPLASALLRDGWTRALIGTRGLLGEGWDAPAVNCLVDVTSVAASISTRQMRGRSLRLDPADPAKLASNWDIVCVAPELERGTADYDRFVRRHRHLHAPCEDGSIESGVSHVHPELSPYAPPPAEDFRPLNRAALLRAADPVAARERWRIGEPYRAVELPALDVRAARGGSAAGLGAALAGLAVPAGPAGDVLAPRPAGRPRWWLLPAARRRRFPAVLPLDRVARAVAEAYVALGELGSVAAGSLAWQPRAGGHVRLLLPAGDAAENARFAAAVAEAVEPAIAQRYVLARPLGAVPYGRAWHPVPADLGRNRARANAYRAAFTTWLGPGELRYTGTDAAGREALAEAADVPAGYVTQTRTLWL